jgi:hypothetical protein
VLHEAVTPNPDQKVIAASITVAMICVSFLSLSRVGKNEKIRKREYVRGGGRFELVWRELETCWIGLLHGRLSLTLLLSPGNSAPLGREKL